MLTKDLYIALLCFTLLFDGFNMRTVQKKVHCQGYFWVPLNSFMSTNQPTFIKPFGTWFTFCLFDVVNDQSWIVTFGQSRRSTIKDWKIFSLWLYTQVEADCFLKLLSICLIFNFNLNFVNPFLMKNHLKILMRPTLYLFLIHRNPKI